MRLRKVVVPVSHVFISCALYILHSARTGVILSIPIPEDLELFLASPRFQPLRPRNLLSELTAALIALHPQSIASRGFVQQQRGRRELEKERKDNEKWEDREVSLGKLRRVMEVGRNSYRQKHLLEGEGSGDEFRG